MSEPIRVHIDLGERSYPVVIGDGLIADASRLAALLRPALRGSEVMLVSNDRVAPLYLEAVRRALDGLRVDEFLLPDGEAYKSLAQFERLLGLLLERKHSRATTLIAVGGGVVGDLTGFAAACYQRGVAFIQLPTTLLAQVDSSVGGKTAVNHPLGKNMIGAFHQPRLVVADTRVLDSLPGREFAAGMAEVIKYGAIADAAFFSWLEANVRALRAREPQALAQAIERSVATKAAVVADDEREAGRRAILNFGHTFGHALETCTGYQHYLHGEAVAVGMVLAAELSLALEQVEPEVPERLRKLLAAFDLPVTVEPILTAPALVEAMSRDKKVIDGRLRLILLDALGAVSVSERVDGAGLQQFLSSRLPAAGQRSHG
ncbi:MAG: 3-dehydroquinate synthase [Pseudomonadota bacterium]